MSITHDAGGHLTIQRSPSRLPSPYRVSCKPPQHTRRPPHLDRHVQTLWSPDCWQARAWHSTEMPSLYLRWMCKFILCIQCIPLSWNQSKELFVLRHNANTDTSSPITTGINGRRIPCLHKFYCLLFVVAVILHTILGEVIRQVQESIRRVVKYEMMCMLPLTCRRLSHWFHRTLHQCCV